jgi:hypothetical protein
MGMRLASVLALVLGVATFAGPALAGNGNGNANGGGNGNNGKVSSSSAAVSASGNSANAPGQVKKVDDTSSSLSTTTTTATAAVSSAPASSQGVKPANDTAHDTHAAASSTKTKLYGNGKTAGQIAIHNGAPPSTVLHGPGNSQPHKASPCSGGHEVDVHALKAKRHVRGCGSGSGPTGSDGGKKDEGSGTGSDPGHASDPATQPGGASSAQSTVTRPKPKSNRSPSMTGPESASVLAAVQRPAGGTLPFTGFPLWAGIALGVVLLGLGLALSLLAGRETEREVRP